MADFERYLPMVFDRAFRLTRDRDRAMDVVQDVFLKWNRQCQTSAPGNPGAWLRTVTTRRVFELARSPQLRVVQADGRIEPAAPETRPRLTGPDHDLLRDDVIQALESLTDMQRDVVLAKILDDQTFKTIASDFDIAESTTKTHYLRAIRSLRDALSPRWRDE